MSTLKQKNLAKIVLNNPNLLIKGGKARLVELGGYGKAIQTTPAKVLESVGFKQELANLGLTDELIATSLVHDIKKKPKQRLGELRLGAEILGMKAAEGQGNTFNTLNIFNGERASKIARRIIGIIGGVSISSEPSEKQSN